LSSIGSRHPERVAGLIYLDAGYEYACYDPSRGNLNIDLQELLRKLNQLQPGQRPQDPSKLIQELLQSSLPGFEKDLQEIQQNLQQPKPPTPPHETAADLESFQAWRARQKRVFGYGMPESELRQERESTDGHVGKPRTESTLFFTMARGQQQYPDIRGPVLAIFAVPHSMGPYALSDPSLPALETRDVAYMNRIVMAFESCAPSARVTSIPHANHLVFISNEADVLREMRTFLAGLN
jgi:non-heme chloroperoxidase